MSYKKKEILDALAKGVFKVEYQLPENVEVRDVEGIGEIYVVDPLYGCECMTGEGCDNGGCTVTVCGIKFKGRNGRLGDEHIRWQCDDDELKSDVGLDEPDEEVVAALNDHVTIFDIVGEDEVKELLARYLGKPREELESKFFLLGVDDIPGEDDEIIEIP